MDDDESGSVENMSKCERVREHLIDLRLGAATLPPSELAQHRAAMRQAMGSEFLTTCAGERRPERLQCALEADDLMAATACMTTAASTTN